MPMEIKPDHSIRNKFLASLKYNGPFRPIVEKPLAKILSLDYLDQWYKKALATPGTNFVEQIISTLNISARIPDKDIENIPETGPCIIVANHPFGGIEGIILASILSKKRPDFKILANFYLSFIPELQNLFIFVDPFNKSDSAAQNIAPIKQAIKWVRNGGILAVFPAGTVSHFDVWQGLKYYSKQANTGITILILPSISLRC
jgi:hypothetical protein